LDYLLFLFLFRRENKEKKKQKEKEKRKFKINAVYVCFSVLSETGWGMFANDFFYTRPPHLLCSLSYGKAERAIDSISE